MQACLSWWNTVSPFGGIGSTLALVFVLLVAGVKAVWEDIKRHQEDVKTNKSVAHLVNADGNSSSHPPATFQRHQFEGENSLQEAYLKKEQLLDARSKLVN